MSLLWACGCRRQAEVSAKGICVDAGAGISEKFQCVDLRRKTECEDAAFKPIFPVNAFASAFEPRRIVSRYMHPQN